METITFRCTSCKFVLKVGADKAGRNAKCSKCGTLLKIPAQSDAAPPAPPAPAAKKTDDDEDGEQTYGLKEAPTPAEASAPDAAPAAPKVLQKPGRPQTKKQAQITNPEEWRKVALGSRIIAVALGIWLVAFVLSRVPLVLGMAQGEEFAKSADTRLLTSSSDSGKRPDLDLYAFAIGIIAGEDLADTMMMVARLSQVLMLLGYLPLLVGYVICFVVPDRFGTRFQLKFLFGLALVNAMILIFFRLLPLFGAIRYTLLPFAMPEVAMLEMNAERGESLVAFWSKSPLMEVYLAILLTILNYLEPALIASFLHSVGKGVKSEELEGNALKAMKLGFSQVFIQVAWLMAAVCGTSVVLLWTLRFVYTVGAGFFIYQLFFTIMTLIGVKPVVEDQLGDEAGGADAGEEQDEEQEDD